MTGPEPTEEELAQAIEHLAGRMEPLIGQINTLVEEVAAMKDEQGSVVLTLRGTNGGEINPGLLREFATLRTRFNAFEKRTTERRIPWTAVSALIAALGAVVVAWINR